MRTNPGQWTLRGALALVALWACAVLTPALADEGDPPGRVARLSDVEGPVSLEPAGMDDWTSATLNRPLTTGDRLWADQGARAELDLGDAVIRLGSNTAFAFLNLDDNSAQLQVTAGTLLVTVRELSPSQVYEIDTPNVALLLEQPGAYRVEVSETGDATLVKVGEGAAQASGITQSVPIGAAQQVTFTGSASLAYDATALGPPDGLDEWAASRDGQYDDSTSAEYLADDIPGTQDLDNNGRWQDAPEYGYVWVPTAIVVGWVPYRFGRWVWVTPWGWTWVDDARWGYAPFHYGRWVQWRSSWCWVPGPSQLHPVYAPALVAWVGAPSAATTVASKRNTGWFPLGPGEVYAPAYPASTNYVRNVNITNTAVVSSAVLTGVAQNQAATRYVNNRPDAVTVVPQQVMISGQRVGGHVVHPPVTARSGATVSTAPTVPPIRQSVLGPDEGRAAARPAAALVQRPVLAHAPPPRAPAPFEKQLAGIQENGGRPLSHSELARLQPATTVAPVKVVTASAVAIGATSATRHSGAPQGSASTTQASGTASLVERERQLQNATLPPARAANPAAPVAHANASLPPARPGEPIPATAPTLRTDRPPWAQQTQLSAPSSSSGFDELTHDAPASASPPEHPATSSPGVEVHQRQIVQTTDTHPEAAPPAPQPAATKPPPPPAHSPAQPAPPAHPPPQTAHPPPPPAPKQSSVDPRDEAAHGDRESRERATR